MDQNKHVTGNTGFEQAVPEERAVREVNKPPLFDSWNGMYVFVLVLHALVIAALYFLTLNYQ